MAEEAVSLASVKTTTSHLNWLISKDTDFYTFQVYEFKVEAAGKGLTCNVRWKTKVSSDSGKSSSHTAMYTVLFVSPTGIKAAAYVSKKSPVSSPYSYQMRKTDGSYM